jgi:kumamolisin
MNPQPIPLRESLRGQRTGAVAGERLDPRLVVPFSLRLRPRGFHRASVQALSAGAQAPPTERPTLDREAFLAAHDADPNERAALVAYLTRLGCTIDDASSWCAVHGQGTVRTVERAFGVVLRTFASPNGTYRSYEGPIALPGRLAIATLGVFGLDDRGDAIPHTRAGKSDTAVAYASLARRYRFPSGLDGEGRHVALLHFGGGFNPHDLAAACAARGEAMPPIDVIRIDGMSGIPGKRGEEAYDREIALGMQIVAALAPAARQTLVLAPNDERGYLDAFSKAIFLDNRPDVIAMGYGFPEARWSPAFVRALEDLLAAAAMFGITIIASSGDSGSAGPDPGDATVVQYPASSPYVLACGGTQFDPAQRPGTAQEVWNNLGASGGGESERFAVPTWQRPSRGIASDHDVTSMGRGVPDVAAHADPGHGFPIVCNGETILLGGTSAAAPLWAALVARIAQRVGKPLGYIQPLLYAAAAKEQACEAVTIGTNGTFRASAGWNACTGLGTPDGELLLRAFTQSSDV